MSHFTKIKTQLVRLEYLKRALDDLKYKYSENQTIGGFGMQRMQVDLAIPTQGYAIGFKKNGDAYDLVGDWFGVRGVDRKKFLQEVTQRYAYHAARDKLEAQGFQLVGEEVEADGRVHMVLRRMA